MYISYLNRRRELIYDKLKSGDASFLPDGDNKHWSLVFADMTGIIPEEEDEDDGETYDDVGQMPEPIDDDIYEELPGYLFQDELRSCCSPSDK